MLKKSSYLLTLLSQLAVSNWSVGRKSLQAHAMLMAVSCLSPVSTHTLIPAVCKASIVSGTSSCNRSTIPVAPEDKELEEITTILNNYIIWYTIWSKYVDTWPSIWAYWSSHDKRMDINWPSLYVYKVFTLPAFYKILPRVCGNLCKFSQKNICESQFTPKDVQWV